MRIILLGMATAALSFGALTHIYVDQRHDFEKGKPFGAAGPLERITGWAVYSPDTKVSLEYIKPRMPEKANGALVLLTGKPGDMPKELLTRGYSVLRMETGNAAAIRDLVAYLRYGGKVPTFLLADQRRVIKRAILVGEPAALQSILESNATSKQERLFDAVVVTGGKDYKAPEGVKVAPAKSQPHAAVVEIDSQLGGPSK